MKILKKLLSVFMSLCTMFLIPIGKVKAEDVVNMMVICQSQDILDKFEKYLSQYEFDSSIEKLKTHDKGYPICSRGVVKKRVHIEKALYDNEENFKNKYFEKLHDMTQVIIIYDISDPTLDSLVENYSKISGDNWKDLYNMNTFLSNCIRLLMEDSIKDGWYNSFNFLTYNEDKYTNGDLNERRRKINHYTCSLELKLHIDNRWGRGHPPYSKCLPGALGNFSGSISGSERHKDEFKKKEDIKAVDITNKKPDLPQAPIQPQKAEKTVALDLIKNLYNSLTEGLTALKIQLNEWKKTMPKEDWEELQECQNRLQSAFENLNPNPPKTCSIM